jgi:hypothetical protein
MGHADPLPVPGKLPDEATEELELPGGRVVGVVDDEL